MGGRHGPRVLIDTPSGRGKYRRHEPITGRSWRKENRTQPRRWPEIVEHPREPRTRAVRFDRSGSVGLVHRHADRGGSGRRAVRHSGERSRRGELSAGKSCLRVGCRGSGDPTIQGFATDISVNRGGTIEFKIDTTARRVRDPHLPVGLLRRRRGTSRRHHPVSVRYPDRTARLHPGPGAREPPRLRQLVGLGQLDRARRRRLGHLHRQADAARRRRRQPHPVHRPKRRQHLRGPLQDLRHDLAVLQRLRQRQPLRLHRHDPRPQGQLQPAVPDPGHRAGELPLQRRVPDAALARAQRL